MNKAAREGDIPYRTLGSTGERVSAIGIGGFHLGGQTLPEPDSIRIIRTALDSGINFLDNCWDYNKGQSEIRMGKALRDGYRDSAFLMTKIDGRDRKTATKQIDESLHRLDTDRIDLLQFHECIRMDDPERIFAAGGALEAALDAKDSGKIRYIGFTGHKSPDVHLTMLDLAVRNQFQFDAVQMPLNVMDAHYDSFANSVVPDLVKAGIGVIGMKPMGDRIIMMSGVVSAIECVHYAMNLPTSVVITGCDSMKVLEQALEAARTFKPMTQREVDELLARTAPHAQHGEFELYKTSQVFDSTSRNPAWLGDKV
jgi:aryl-alcohol dehydrogenase-like predicted oxidoreductase